MYDWQAGTENEEINHKIPSFGKTKCPPWPVMAAEDHEKKAANPVNKADILQDLQERYLVDPGLTLPEEDRIKTTGILKAARLGGMKMLTELYKEGYSLMSTDETGKTGLHYAARFAHKDIIQLLIEKADDTQKIMDHQDIEKGQTALHKAAAGHGRGGP